MNKDLRPEERKTIIKTNEASDHWVVRSNSPKEIERFTEMWGSPGGGDSEPLNAVWYEWRVPLHAIVPF